MTPRYQFDADDPFGTRPDEKPPQGWEARFWEGVRERIEDHRKEPGRPSLPEPPRRQRASARAAAIAALVMLAATAATLLLSSASAPPGPAREDPSSTVVRVSGAQDPAVAVEWARSGGCRSGYVVLQSLEPDISYVLIDRRLTNP